MSQWERDGGDYWQTRVARKSYHCDANPCPLGGTIREGDEYEYHKVAPWHMDYMPVWTEYRLHVGCFA